MNLPGDVHKTLTVCSLRFDGYRWLETRHPGTGTNDFRPYVEPVVETLQLHADEEANFAACFALQRFLGKWGGEMLPAESREHVAWRYLFLHLYRREVPARFRVLEYADRWEREHLPRADAHAALVREALLVNGPGRDLPVTLDDTRTLNPDLIEVATWSLVSELVRRAPGRLRVIQTHPGGGLYDCLAVFDGSRHLCDWNREGTLHLGRRFDGREATMPGSLDVWARLAAGENPRGILDEVCGHLGLIPPTPLPASTPSSLTYRVIAAALKQTVFGPARWRCVNGTLDTSGYGGGMMEEHFVRFPGARERLGVREENDFFQQSAYRFWFLERDGKPMACFETNGTAWQLGKGSPCNLMSDYRRLKSVDSLAAELGSNC